MTNHPKSVESRSPGRKEIKWFFCNYRKMKITNEVYIKWDLKQKKNLMIPCHCIRHLMFLSICQRDVWSPTWLTLTSSLKVLLATQRADEYFHLMSNEYFPNEVCDVALEIENSSVCLRGREDGFMSSSLLPGMIWLSPTTQDGNNIKVKWWNAEIKGARQVHQICYDAPKFLLASVFCSPSVSCLAV